MAWHRQYSSLASLSRVYNNLFLILLIEVYYHTVHPVLFAYCKFTEKKLFANYFNIGEHLNSRIPGMSIAFRRSGHFSTHIDLERYC